MTNQTSHQKLLYLRDSPWHSQQRGSHHRIPNTKDGNDGTLPFSLLHGNNDEEVGRDDVIGHHEGGVGKGRQLVVLVAGHGSAYAGRSSAVWGTEDVGDADSMATPLTLPVGLA